MSRYEHPESCDCDYCGVERDEFFRGLVAACNPVSIVTLDGQRSAIMLSAEDIARNVDRYLKESA